MTMSILTGINIFYLSFDSLAVAANWNNISFLIRIIFDTKYDDEIRKILCIRGNIRRILFLKLEEIGRTVKPSTK